MAKNNKQNRRAKGREVKAAKQQSAPKVYQLPHYAKLREEEKIELPHKRYLILCEGITEKSYFKGIQFNPILKRKLSAVQVDIVAPPDDSDEDSLRDNSLKGLVWEGMQRKKKADTDENSYDEIWIVIDHDGRNGYQIPANIPNVLSDMLSAPQIQIFTQHAKSVFLSDYDYMNFLQNHFENADLIQQIFENSSKHREYEKFEDCNGKRLFLKNGIFDYAGGKEIDFDPTWQNYIKMAYSCRSFETWLILHFERSDYPFISSDDTDLSPANIVNNEDSIHYLRSLALR